jgi:hypothetical protein
MPEDPKEMNISVDNPGKTTSDVKPDDSGAAPTPLPPAQGEPGGEGPSASAKPGPHSLDPTAKPLPGQPEPDSASSTEEVTVRTETPKTVKAEPKDAKKK